MRAVGYPARAGDASAATTLANSRIVAYHADEPRGGDMIQVLLAATALVSSLTPLVGLVCLLSLPLQRWADRLRPAPGGARYRWRLLASLAVPTLGFVVMAAGIAAFFRVTYRPSTLMLEPVVSLWLLLLVLIGAPGNAAFSAYRTWRWYQAHRAALRVPFSVA